MNKNYSEAGLDRLIAAMKQQPREDFAVGDTVVHKQDPLWTGPIVRIDAKGLWVHRTCDNGWIEAPFLASDLKKVESETE